MLWWYVQPYIILNINTYNIFNIHNSVKGIKYLYPSTSGMLDIFLDSKIFLDLHLQGFGISFGSKQEHNQIYTRKQ